MTRSEINALNRHANSFFASHHFALPPFASWSPADWAARRADADEDVRGGLGRDVTDFGSGTFASCGLLPFTLRYGSLSKPRFPKPYAEKITVVRENQITPPHRHIQKTEDIIVRGGADLVFERRNAGPDGAPDDSRGEILRDGLPASLPTGFRVRLREGESLALRPGFFHAFGAEGGTSSVAEVSLVNDDYADNVFIEPFPRLPTIEEVEPPHRSLVGNYPASPDR